MKNIFITGDIRIGKSTVIKKVLDSNKAVLGVLKKNNCSLINDIKKEMICFYLSLIFTKFS